MARNKYPEVTEARILEAAAKLFLEKGYDNTTIQDIVDELGDLTRGAVYHHFKSKADILEAVLDHMTGSSTVFTEAAGRETLGLDQLRAILRVSTSPERNPDEITLNGMYLEAAEKNPRFVVQQLDDAFNAIAPIIQGIMETGNADGSLSVPYTKQAAQVFSLLVSVWFNWDLAQVSEEEFVDRVRFLQYLTDSVNIPVIDEAFIEDCRLLIQRYKVTIENLHGEE